MTLPADIARIKYPWRRRPSDAWTNEALRAEVLTFLATFLAGHGWADAWEVTERFTSTSVNVRVPRTPPVQVAEGDDFKQRDGVRILVFGIRRAKDRRVFEVGTGFPVGNAIPALDLEMMLDRVRAAVEAEERKA